MLSGNDVQANGRIKLVITRLRCPRARMSVYNEKFCLKWNDFRQNIATSYRGLREQQDFSDVTLVCEDDQQIEAHRVILSACSPFFLSILKKTKHSHPMIYMRGMNAKYLTALVDFMYYGEANIYQEDLDGFLALAEELKLRGLGGETQEENYKFKQDFRQIPKPHKSSETFFTNNTKEEKQDEYSDISTYGSEIVAQTDNMSTSVVSVANVDELDEYIHTMMGKVDGGWNCKVCGKIATKPHMRQHIETHHIEGPSHPCDQCDTVCRSRHALAMHKQIQHSI